MLHAFDTTDGKELWAFIPPNMIPKLKNMRSSFANTTNSISGVDGSPVVKAIYYDNDGDGTKEWRTIAMVGMGPGGKGYFALDITDTEKPSHLFTFENNPVDRIVSFWNADGDKLDYSYKQGESIEDYDYSNLGSAYSSPYILRMGIDGTDKWVAVFGGGYNMGINKYASSVFVVDLENGGLINEYKGGKLIKDINLVDKIQKERELSLNKDNIPLSSVWAGDGFNNQFEVTFPYDDKSDVEVYVDNQKTDFTWTNKYFIEIDEDNAPIKDAKIVIKGPKILNEEINNSVPTRLSMLLTDNISEEFDSANYKGAMFYALDIEGKVWKIDMTGDTASFKKNILFDGEADTYNQRHSFHQITIDMIEDKNIGVYFGTGNMKKIGLVDEQRFKDKNLSDGKKEELKIRNRVYGIKDKKFPEFIEIDDSSEKNSLTNQDYEKGSLSINKCSKNSCPKDSDLGWYSNLNDGSGTKEIKNDKVTGKILIFNDTLHVPRYAASYNKPCEAGRARISFYNKKCGKSVTGFGGTKKVVDLGKGLISSPILYKGKVYLPVSGEKSDTDVLDSDNPCVRDPNLYICQSGSSSTNTYKIIIDSWRELF